MAKHLVLGSEGQIGRYVCNEIEANGDEVIRWDIKLNEGKDLRLIWSMKSNPLSKAMEESDFVHFLAYDVGGSTYLAKNQNSYQYIHNNISIMENVFWHLKANNKPFYFASSQMSNMTDSVYGQLKAVGESYTRALGGGIVRFWNVYGYEPDPEKTHVITDFIKQALNEGIITCKTDGQEMRHFTHAEDAAWMLYNVYKYYEKFDNNYYLDVARSTNKVGEGWTGWTTIESIAQVIGYFLNVPVYFSKKVDKIQTIKNDIDRYLWQTIRDEDLGAQDREWITLTDGIIDMIERIEEDD